MQKIFSRIFTMKSYGPYIRNGKQYWRNYSREISRADAKTYIEIMYMDLPEHYPKLIDGDKNVQTLP